MSRVETGPGWSMHLGRWQEAFEERALGIAAGLAWRAVPGVLPVFYIDRGWSRGMLAARDTYDREGIIYELRRLEACS